MERSYLKLQEMLPFVALSEMRSVLTRSKFTRPMKINNMTAVNGFNAVCESHFWDECSYDATNATKLDVKILHYNWETHNEDTMKLEIMAFLRREGNMLYAKSCSNTKGGV